MSSFRCQHLQGRAISALVNRDGLLARIKEPLVSETGATQEAGWAR
jgi:hypothetical protein